MTAKEVWIEAIVHRPAMRERTSRSASRADSPSKRSASSAERPIDLPSRMPDTLRDSWTSEEMSAIAPCFVAVVGFGLAPARGGREKKKGRNPSEDNASRQSSRE